MTDRLPPHSIEAEAGILGCILLSPADCLGECVEKIKPGGDVFYDQRHRTLYLTLLAMFNEGAPIDLISLQNRMRRKHNLDKCGGLAYLSSLPDAVPSAANLEYYIDIVLEKYLLRKLVQTCVEIVGRANDLEGEVKPFLDQCERDILAIQGLVESSRGIVDQVECVKSLFDRYTKAMEIQHHLGLQTGFKDLDAIIGGLDGPEFVILTGSQSSLKTTLLMNIFCNLAKQNICSGVISLETTAEKLVHRNLCSLSGVNGQRLNMGVPNEGDFDKISEASKEVIKMKDKILIDDTSKVTLPQCESKMRRMVQMGAKIIGIDFMQLLLTNETGAERLANISQGLKNAGKELNVPVIAISTLTKEEIKSGRQPTVDGLYGTVQFQFDATMIILLWVEEKERQSDVRTLHGEVGKNKDGRNGNFKLTAYAPGFKIRNFCPIDKSDIPKVKSPIKEDDE